MSTLEMLSIFLDDVFGVNVSVGMLTGVFLGALLVLLLGAALYEFCFNRKKNKKHQLD